MTLRDVFFSKFICLLKEFFIVKKMEHSALAYVFLRSFFVQYFKRLVHEVSKKNVVIS